MRHPVSVAAAMLAASAWLAPGHGLAQVAAEANEQSPGDFGELNLEALLRLKVVTASSGGAAEDADLAPANVFTVLASEIANQGWRSVADVLANVPGMYVVDDYVTYNVGVRGASGGIRAGTRIIKVMINGTDVSFRPDLNALIGPEFIPIEMVDRIEIVRGPLSALYGANAFLATVNVITVNPERSGAQVGAGGAVRPQPGTTRFGWWGSGMASAALGERVRLVLGATYGQMDRGGLTIERTFPNQSTANSPQLGQTSGKDLARPASVFGRLTVGLGRAGDLSLQGGLQQMDSAGEFQLNSVLTGRTRQSIRNLWIEARHQAKWTDMLSSQLSLGAAQGAPTSTEKMYVTGAINPATGNYYSYYTRNFDYLASDATASVSVQPRPSLRLSAGVDGSWERHGTLFYSQHYVEAFGGFNAGDVIVNSNSPVPVREVTVQKIAPNVHASLTPHPNVRIYADGRLDATSLFPNQYSWRASAGWRIRPNLVVKAIAGRAFQTPSTVFLYAYQGFGASNDIQGSRNIPAAPPLVPQVVQSVELVLSALLGETVSANVAGYAQTIDNQLAFQRNAGVYFARNQGKATSVGGEVNLTARLWRFEPYVRFSKQWFESGAVQEGTGPEVPPAFIPSYWGLAGLRATIPSPRITFDATFRRVGERGASQSNTFLNGSSYALPAYNQLDLASTIRLSVLGKNRETFVSASVRNALDQKHFEPGFGGLDLPTPGRTFLLNASQSF